MLKVLLELSFLALAVFMCQTLVGMEEKEEEQPRIPCQIEIYEKIHSEEQCAKWLKEYVEQQERLNCQRIPKN